MLPTVPPSPQPVPASRPQRVPAGVTRLDGVLFQASGWFVIDAANQRVPQVVITSLAQGLDLVGHGEVATVVGRLADGFVVVDVDLTGHKGHGVVEAIARWCRQNGLWHLVRPSGGAEGRSHVFVAVQGHQEALVGLIDELRRTWRGSRSTIDLRTAVRPLSAPHRTGQWTAPLGNLRAALSQIPAPAPPGRHSSGRKRTAAQNAVSSTPLVPRRQRPRRELPEEWVAYAARGERPVIAEDHAGGRSNHEALATAHLLWAGHDADTAWEQITGAHRKAFVKARSKGRSWWVRHVWNPAVEADDAYVGQVCAPSPPTAAAVAQARERLRTSAGQLTDRKRPYYLTIGHTVLDRMERTGATRIPVPERDLVLDTGLTDRRTIRGHLALLERAGVLLVHRDTLDDTARASTSYEAEIPTPGGVGVPQQIPPPRLHTPLPHLIPPDSPAATWLVLRELTDDPQDLTSLALASQMSTTAHLSPGQLSTLRAALMVLSSIGLALCDEAGQWRRGAGMTSAATRQARDRNQELRAVIEAERTAYRQRHGALWDAQRAAALKRQRAKEVAWWRGLPVGERDRRRSLWTARFAAGNVEEQRQLKAQLVERERRRGTDPVRRHQEWVARYATEDRRLERAEAYARLAPPLQAAWARAWAEHRTQQGIPRDLLPHGRIVREFSAAGPQVDEAEDGRLPLAAERLVFGEVVP